MESDNEDKDKGVADVDDDDSYDDINKRVCYYTYKSIQQGITILVFVEEVLIK
jgi:hypothetical protein